MANHAVIDSAKISAMRAGGKQLAAVKAGLADFVKVGMTFEAVEAEAQRLIKSVGATPSFSTVPGYHWATCLMKTNEMCHGIPQKKRIEDGEILKIDVGLINNGYHLDTTISLVVGSTDAEKEHFLEVGRQTLAKAIKKAQPGNTVFDISRALQKGVETHGYGAVYQLTGHGIGKKLHDEPSIPCVAEKRDKKIKLVPGMTIAIEIMYTEGASDLVLDYDGWTYVPADGSWCGMFEETVLVTEQGPEILTAIG